MDRAAKLAALAALAGRFIRSEVHWRELVDADENRRITRRELAAHAEKLGFANNEVSAAVDEALTAAGTTP